MGKAHRGSFVFLSEFFNALGSGHGETHIDQKNPLKFLCSTKASFVSYLDFDIRRACAFTKTLSP